MTARDAYWIGYRHGRHLAEHDRGHNHEPALRFAVDMYTAPSNRARRAFTLGELRGYREATR